MAIGFVTDNFTFGFQAVPVEQGRGLYESFIQLQALAVVEHNAGNGEYDNQDNRGQPGTTMPEKNV